MAKYYTAVHYQSLELSLFPFQAELQSLLDSNLEKETESSFS